VRALRIREKTLPPDHPDTRKLLEHYAELLRKTGRAAEADAMSARARTPHEGDRPATPGADPLRNSHRILVLPHF